MTGSSTSSNHFFSAKQLLTTSIISVVYLLLCYWLIGYKQDQLTLVLLFNACYYLSSITRKFITGFAIFIVFWIIFDLMKAFPNYLYQGVHIESLYNLIRHTNRLLLSQLGACSTWIRSILIFQEQKMVLAIFAYFFISQSARFYHLLCISCSTTMVCTTIWLWFRSRNTR